MIVLHSAGVFNATLRHSVQTCDAKWMWTHGDRLHTVAHTEYVGFRASCVKKYLDENVMGETTDWRDDGMVEGEELVFKFTMFDE
ncbi:hypothetical protein Hypma_004900 [Hypsizygus marmoreus]|uniref:Uncharacterized protein n=1 Tax=Hypsizygus marmoreus TaxID=39966 RepID=A0A369KBX0_HYPMA|nr:hypothetical protein Hypma_004900 [Hypsizygus marmoreus]